MKHFNRKIKIALFIMIIMLVAFVSFSKVGILFSTTDDFIITVSTPKNSLKPSKYAASIIDVLNKEEKEPEEEKEEIMTTTSQPQEKEPEAEPVNVNVDVASLASEPTYDGQTLSEIAQKLNSHFKGSLTNMGELFARLCIEKGMDPYFLAAISVHETGNGQSYAALNKYNFGGIMCSGSLCSYPSIEEGITKFIDVVYNNYFSKGLVTAEQMNSKYAASTTWATQVNGHYNNLKNN